MKQLTFLFFLFVAISSPQTLRSKNLIHRHFSPDDMGYGDLGSTVHPTISDTPIFDPDGDGKGIAIDQFLFVSLLPAPQSLWIVDGALSRADPEFGWVLNRDSSTRHFIPRNYVQKVLKGARLCYSHVWKSICGTTKPDFLHSKWL